MFNFRLFDGSLTTRLFVALTVALCIFSILTLTLDAREMMPEAQVKEQEESSKDTATEGVVEVAPEMGHIHEGDPVKGTGCYARPIFHEHTGSKKKGGGCYGKEIIHTHSGDSQNGGGCYGEAIFHTHSGSSSGGGCYGKPIYHSHTGNSTTGGGCYGNPIFHSHQGDETQGGPCYATPIYHQHEGVEKATYANGCFTQPSLESVGYECGEFFDQGDDTWKCGTCGWVIPSWNLPLSRRHWPFKDVTVYVAGCGKNEQTVEGYALSCILSTETVEGYGLSCGKAGHVEGYELNCGKSIESVESYALTCGFSEGQVEGYKRNCQMTTETIVGYELSCNILEESQPVKVPFVTDNAEFGEQKGDSETDLQTDFQEGQLIFTVDLKEMETKEFAANKEKREEEITDGDSKEKMDTRTNENALALQELEVQKKTVGAKKMWTMALVTLLLGIFLKAYFSRTLALFYYDEEGQYHSLGRILFRRSDKGYHVQIGNAIRRKATTDRYRIRTHRQMRKRAEKQHLYVRISTQVMKLHLEEYVDFAL